MEPQNPPKKRPKNDPKSGVENRPKAESEIHPKTGLKSTTKGPRTAIKVKSRHQGKEQIKLRKRLLGNEQQGNLRNCTKLRNSLLGNGELASLAYGSLKELYEI
jgi:hypothetical protein